MVNTLTPRRVALTQVNTLTPKKKTQTKEELARAARAKRIKALKAKRSKPGTKFRQVRPSVLKAPKKKKAPKAKNKKVEEDEGEFDDFIVDDESEGEYIEAESGDESDGEDLDGVDFDKLSPKEKKQYLDEKEAMLTERRNQRKGDIEALLARLEAKARKKAKKDNLTLPSEDAFVKKVQSKCPDVKALKEELADIKKQLAECRAKKCKVTRKTRAKKVAASDIKPVPKKVSDAVRRARIEKIKAKRKDGGMKMPTRKPKAKKELKPCSVGYTRNPKTNRCVQIKKEKSCPAGSTLNFKSKRCVKDKTETKKVSFAKFAMKGDLESPAAKKRINEYFTKDHIKGGKTRLKDKEQMAAFKKAQKEFYKMNPSAKPKRVRKKK